MILNRLFSRPQALTSEDLSKVLRGRSQSVAGVDVTTDRALQLAAVFACVRVLAESVGQLPLRLYRTVGKEKLPADDHPLHALLTVAPNEFQTAQEWREWLIGCLALNGNAYSFVNRERARVLELLPLAHSAVTPKQDKDTNEVTYEVRLRSGKMLTLPADEVLHIKLFSLDGVCGVSPIRYAREAIGLSIATEQHGASLFGNGAMPSGVLTHPKTLGDEPYKRLRESWEERHQGPENAHKIALLEDGVKWEPMSVSSIDAQFLETRKYQRSEIAGLFRVPPHLIGDLERATFSNIEHQGLDFVVHALMPYLTRIEARIRMQLLSPAEQKSHFAKFNVNGLLRGDMAARSTFYTQGIQNGSLSPNEIRELEDRNPREGGDVFLQPANMIVSGSKADEQSADPSEPPSST